MDDPLKVAPEVWLATALLHTEFPQREYFSVKEIVDRVVEEGLVGQLRKGVQTHASQHCVANKRPNPNGYRMLFAVGRGRRRLYRPGDDYHPFRQGGIIAPARTDIPVGYRHLLEWYHRVYSQLEGTTQERDAGPVFRERAASILAEHFGVELKTDQWIPLGQPPHPHRFDLASPERDFVGECREYSDLETGGVSRADLRAVHEAVLFLTHLSGNNYRVVVLPRIGGLPSLAEHYHQNYRHLLGGVRLVELDTGGVGSRRSKTF